MPTYRYHCPICNTEFEIWQSITKRHESTCPGCKNESNTLLIGCGGGFIFKGDGFYESTKKERGDN